MKANTAIEESEVTKVVEAAALARSAMAAKAAEVAEAARAADLAEANLLAKAAEITGVAKTAEIAEAARVVKSAEAVDAARIAAVAEATKIIEATAAAAALESKSSRSWLGLIGGAALGAGLVTAGIVLKRRQRRRAVQEDQSTTRGHLTLAFPMKSAADCAAIRDEMPGLDAKLYRAADAMGTMHYCRFFTPNDSAVYMLADYDGELETVIQDMARHFGPVLDPLLAHVSDAPPTPVDTNSESFVGWAKAHRINAFTGYKAYPDTTAREIKSLASMAGISLSAAGDRQHPLLVTTPIKGHLSLLTVEGALKLLKGQLTAGANTVGTIHFAHLVELPGNQIGFFTVYDGSFDQYAHDFTEALGPAFDLIFQFTEDPPPTPTAQHPSAFAKWVKEHDQAPLAFYSAYPGLQVTDIKALTASTPAPAYTGASVPSYQST